MKKEEIEITEEVILFASVIKWVVLAVVVGIIVGLSTTFFLKIINWGSGIGNKCPNYFLLLPLGLFLSAALIKYLAPDAEGHGTEKVIEAIHKHSGRIKPMVVPVKLIATFITIAAGGSVGKEGPCAQIGGGISSILAGLLKFNNADRKKLVICGISAGFASVFGTPIAGAIFGVEVLFMGGILYDVLMPSFVAGIISYHISSSLGISYFYNPLSFAPVFSEKFFLKIVLAGIFFGLCAALLIEILKLGNKISKKLRISEPMKGVVGGGILICLVFVFSKQYLGLGLETIESSLHGASVIWYAFILKMVFTSITLNFGGSGGIVTAIFFIGATAGTLFATLLGLDLPTFAAIGLVSVLAGASNTPIAASVMAVELFGTQIAPYAAIACVISFLMTGYRSVYPSQVLAIKKSSSIKVKMGQEIDHVILRFPRRIEKIKSILKRIVKRYF